MNTCNHDSLVGVISIHAIININSAVVEAATAEARQPWTNTHDCYFEYLIIHFDYLIIPLDYLIIPLDYLIIG